MRILRKITLFVIQVFLGIMLIFGMILGLFWGAFKAGFRDYSESFVDMLASWQNE
jgi:hypothetical protein